MKLDATFPTPVFHVQQTQRWSCQTCHVLIFFFDPKMKGKIPHVLIKAQKTSKHWGQFLAGT